MAQWQCQIAPATTSHGGTWVDYPQPVNDRLNDAWAGPRPAMVHWGLHYMCLGTLTQVSPSGTRRPIRRVLLPQDEDTAPTQPTNVPASASGASASDAVASNTAFFEGNSAMGDSNSAMSGQVDLGDADE